MQLMNIQKLKLSNNQLKIIGMIAMLCDHAGKELFPQFRALQIIGRLALPVFAYMIAEGCRYTRNRKSYLLKIAILAFGCQAVYFIAEGSLYQNILITFTLSVLIIYAIDNFLKKKDFLSGIIVTATASAVIIICIFLPELIKNRDFNIDYGFFGVMLPVVVYYMPSKMYKIIGAAACLAAISIDLGGIQWYSLLTVLLLAVYNGERGKHNLKYLFYIFYPAHLAVIYIIKILADRFF